MSPTKPNNSTSLVDIDDLKMLGRIFASNWYIILIFLVLSYAAAFIYSYKLIDVYGAQTQILLKSNNEYNRGSIISDNFGAYNGYQSYIDNANEMRVIKSYDLIKETLDKLDLEVSYYIVGRIKTTEMFESSPFHLKVYSINPSLYEQMMRFRVLDETTYELGYVKNGQEIIKNGVFDKELVDLDFRFFISKTHAINAETDNAFNGLEYKIQIHNKDNLIYKFQSALFVENPEYTNIMQISMEDVVPERATQFLDTFSTVYIENSLKSRFEVNQNTLRYIERQMSEVTDVLNSIEDTMQGYKEKKAILDLTREQEDYFSKLSAYDATKSSLNLQLGTLDALERYIIEDKDTAFLPPSVYVLNNDEFLSQSVSQLYSMQLAKNGALVITTEENPAFKDLDERIEMLKRNLLTYISNLRDAFNSKVKDVEKEIEFYIANIKTIPQKQRDLVNIQRKLSVNEKMYLFLLEKRANTIIARAGIIPETRIIETARSIGIVKPNKKKITYTFLSTGLIASLLIVFVRGLFFMRIENTEQLKKYTSLPIYGEVVYSDLAKESYIVVDADPKSLITESFRSIRTNLEYMAADHKSKVVLITSNNPGEGKTFCSINLAAILAKAGKKVLIAELDLHKPRVQIGLKMQSDIGISTVLIGKSSISNTILKTHIENMDVILSGPTPPNASELILSPILKDMFDYARENYDYVIIDTAPIGLISDALVMMKYADAILFVVNTKMATKTMVNNIQEVVTTNKIKNIGLVLNAVKQKKSRYYYNKYGYGYGYGYGYSSTNK